MHPGFSQKSPDAPAPLRETLSTAAAQREAGRIPSGEKGIGRLAAGRLGQSLEVFTRKQKNSPWLHVFFDWHSFDDMTRHLQDVEISYDFETKPDSPPVQSGTVLVIRNLSQRWDTWVPGRSVAGRSKTRLGRLKQDLELLVRPLTASSDVEFTIHMNSDEFLEEKDVGLIEPASALLAADYQYSFEFKVDDSGQISISRRLHRNDEIHRELGGPRTEQFETTVITPALAKEEGRSESLECGPFQGMFLYTPPPAAKRARAIDVVGNGVLLYRDGVLVEPYGIGNDDWIGVAARKAQRQGHALIQPVTFSGYVLISRSENPQLRDMSNRQGLIEEQASEVFVNHVRAEFALFEGHIYDELSTRWTAKEKKATRHATDALERAEIRLRAVAHSLGQPLLGLSTDIVALRTVAQLSTVSKELRSHLVEIAESAEDHIEVSQKVLNRFLDVQPLTRTEVNVAQLVADVIGEVEPLASSLGIRLEVDQWPLKIALVARDLVFEAVKEVVRNGIQAKRPSDRPGILRIKHHEDMGDFVLDVIDNGSGIQGVGPDYPLSLIGSTKGRPAQGLAYAEMIMQASLGRIRIADTGNDGTHIELYLPDRVAGLRSEL